MTESRGVGRGGPRRPDIDVREIGIELYAPHPVQAVLHRSEARFRVACCGRRWGKTFAGANEIAKFAWENPTWNGMATMTWWVAPTYGQAMKAFGIVSTMFKDAIASKKTAVGQMEIIWKNGAKTQFQSAERYDNLRGEGVVFMVLDEAAMMVEKAWTEVLRPMLSDTGGSALFISTPRGKNWFYALWRRGGSEDWPDWESFSFPTASSPYIPQSEIDDAQASLPEDVFAQEYLGAFLEQAAGVFRGVGQCIWGDYEEYTRKHQYVIGWDIAKHTDWSVVTVLDINHVRNGVTVPHVVAWDRINRISYEFQADRVREFCRRYGTYVLLDSTGVGDPVYDMLIVRGVPAFPYLMSGRAKVQLIQNLAIGIQTAQVSFPDNPILESELSAYQYSMSATGQVSYSAPEGDHDDCVISLALAYWAATHPAWLQGSTVAADDYDEVISPI